MTGTVLRAAELDGSDGRFAPLHRCLLEVTNEYEAIAWLATKQIRMAPAIATHRAYRSNKDGFKANGFFGANQTKLHSAVTRYIAWETAPDYVMIAGEAKIISTSTSPATPVSLPPLSWTVI